MPVTTDLDRPVKYVQISGPGVDALEKRKETNNNSPVTASELRTSYEKVKDGLFAGFKALIGAASP